MTTSQDGNNTVARSSSAADAYAEESKSESPRYGYGL